MKFEECEFCNPSSAMPCPASHGREESTSLTHLTENPEISTFAFSKKVVDFDCSHILVSPLYSKMLKKQYFEVIVILKDEKI